jgi:hypothetical protein
MSLARFFTNIGLAYKLHKLRVPADPAAAVERFCKR